MLFEKGPAHELLTLQVGNKNLPQPRFRPSVFPQPTATAREHGRESNFNIFNSFDMLIVSLFGFACALFAQMCLENILPARSQTS
jgi:hypothetical protein